MVKPGTGRSRAKYYKQLLLQVFAIEFVTFAIEIVPFAIEFVGFAVELVGFAIEFVAFALQFVINKTAPRNLFMPWRVTLETLEGNWSW